MTARKAREADAWIGKTMAEVCQRLGNPDLVQPASLYGVKLQGGTPSVVLTYHALGYRWFVSEEGYVLAAIRIKA